MPVMVCVDGFILTHAVERIDIPDAGARRCLPAALRAACRCSIPQEPISIGAMVGPEAFTEVRFLQHYKQTLALRLIPELAAEFNARFGRDSGGLLRTYRAEDAETIVVAMGSVNGTIKDTIDEMRAEGIRIGARRRSAPSGRSRSRRCARRWRRAKRVVVVEKSFAVGHGRAARQQRRPRAAQRRRRAAGAHGRRRARRTRRSPRRRCIELFRQALVQPWEGVHFLDLDEAIVSTGARSTCARCAARARPPRTSCAASTTARSAAADETHDAPQPRDRRRNCKFYQNGTFTVGNRLLAPSAAHRPGLDRPLELAQLAATAPARDAARRSARAMPSTRRCARPAASSSPSTPPAASRCSRRPIRRRRGRCPGCTRCSAMPPRSPPASPPRCGSRDATTCASSPRAATAARPTSASAACPACSSATTTCSTSATTTKAT